MVLIVVDTYILLVYYYVTYLVRRSSENGEVSRKPALHGLSVHRLQAFGVLVLRPWSLCGRSVRRLGGVPCDRPVLPLRTADGLSEIHVSLLLSLVYRHRTLRAY